MKTLVSSSPAARLNSRDEVQVGSLGDVPSLAALCLSLHAASEYRDFHFDTKKVEGLLAYLISDPSGVIFVMRDQGHIVGVFAGGVAPNWFGDDLFGADIWFYVTPGPRSEERATTMVLIFESWCKRRGARRVRLGNSSSAIDDIQASAYRSLGFANAGAMLFKDVGHAMH